MERVMPEFLLTVEQVAERVQMHQETVRRHLIAGKLRGIKRGRLWRVPESAILEAGFEAPDRETQTGAK